MKTAYPMRFHGCINNSSNNTLTLGQQEHIICLSLTDTNYRNREHFRTVRGQLLFITQSSRPDISYSVSQLCQVPFEAISIQDCHRLNKVVSYLKNTPNLQLQYKSLDQKSTKLYVFTDSGYNSNREKTSQLGIIICLVDKFNNCQILH